MLATHLRLLREKNGLTQKQVAEILNIDRSTYAYYECGKTRPDILTIAKLARLYRISTDFLLDVKNPAFHAEFHDDRVEYRTLQSERVGYLSDLSRDEQELILHYRQLSDKAAVFACLQALYDEERSHRGESRREVTGGKG